MDRIIELVQERTGIEESQARTAVDTVIGVLKERLPEPIAGQLDKAARGEKVDAGSALGGMFGG